MKNVKKHRAMMREHNRRHIEARQIRLGIRPKAKILTAAKLAAENLAEALEAAA